MDEQDKNSMPPVTLRWHKKAANCMQKSNKMNNHYCANTVQFLFNDPTLPQLHQVRQGSQVKFGEFLEQDLM